MRTAFLLAGILCAGLGAACSGSAFSESRQGVDGGASGGNTGSGGGSSSNGGSATGGKTGSGGKTSSGGSMGSGGVTATGGVVGSGGVTANGGVVGSGAVVGSGGITAAGGAVGSGGAGTNPCPSSMPASGSPCLSDGLSCPYGTCCPATATCNGAVWSVLLPPCAAPICPPDPPTSGSFCSCGLEGTICDFDQCASGQGHAQARCSSGVWALADIPCLFNYCSAVPCPSSAICMAVVKSDGATPHCLTPSSCSAPLCSCIGTACTSLGGSCTELAGSVRCDVP